MDLTCVYKNMEGNAIMNLLSFTFTTASIASLLQKTPWSCLTDLLCSMPSPLDALDSNSSLVSAFPVTRYRIPQLMAWK